MCLCGYWRLLGPTIDVIIGVIIGVTIISVTVCHGFSECFNEKVSTKGTLARTDSKAKQISKVCVGRGEERGGGKSGCVCCEGECSGCCSVWWLHINSPHLHVCTHTCHTLPMPHPHIYHILTYTTSSHILHPHIYYILTYTTSSYIPHPHIYHIRLVSHPSTHHAL